jgi:hypothetical protein
MVSGMMPNVRCLVEASGIEAVGGLGGGLYYAPGPFRTPRKPADPGRTDRSDADFHGDVNFALQLSEKSRSFPKRILMRCCSGTARPILVPEHRPNPRSAPLEPLFRQFLCEVRIVPVHSLATKKRFS